MVDIKFCGITRSEDARLAADLGARYVGVIFASSPRQLSAPGAAEVLAAVRGAVRCVGVFGDQETEMILSTAKRAGLDCVQLHGTSESSQISELRSRFGGEVWAVARVGDAGLSPGAAALFHEAHAVLLDTLSPRGLGGTGESFDWSGVAGVVSAVRGRARLVVGGGLRPDNVRQAIDVLSPDVVDVSSGVELSPGIKDPVRMRAFVDAVRAHATR